MAAGNRTIDFDTGGKSPYKIGEIDFKDAAQVKKVLDWAEARIVTAPIENAIIITAAGDIYHCTGDLNTLDSIVELGNKLNGAIVTHNHPLGSVNEYSFSDDDEQLFFNYNLFRLRGIDEKFIYELNRNTEDNEFYGHDLTDLYSLGLDFSDRSTQVTFWAFTRGFGYRRIVR